MLLLALNIFVELFIHVHADSRINSSLSDICTFLKSESFYKCNRIIIFFRVRSRETFCDSSVKSEFQMKSKLSCKHDEYHDFVSTSAFRILVVVQFSFFFFPSKEFSVRYQFLPVHIVL